MMIDRYDDPCDTFWHASKKQTKCVLIVAIEQEGVGGVGEVKDHGRLSFGRNRTVDKYLQPWGGGVYDWPHVHPSVEV